MKQDDTPIIKVKVFCYSCPDIRRIEKDINEFFEVGKGQIKNITQSESCNNGGWNLTITIWYEDNNEQ